MKNKNILITGGCGFIGSNIAARLCKENTVSTIDNLYSGRIENIADLDVKFIEADIRGGISDYFKEIDIVFHEAANIFISRSVEDPAYDAGVNVMGMLNVLEACRKNDVSRIVFASSCAVYGDPVVLPVTEDHPKNPKSPYAVSKLTGEYYCKIYAQLYGLKTVTLRYFNVYGKNQRADNPYSGVISIFTDRARKNEPVTIFGSGEQTRDFINVSDVVDANIAAATSENAVGKTFNIGTGNRISLNELIKDIEIITGKKIDRIHTPPREGDIMHSVSEIRLAKKVLNFNPQIDIATGLTDLLKTQ